MKRSQIILIGVLVGVLILLIIAVQLVSNTLSRKQTIPSPTPTFSPLPENQRTTLPPSQIEINKREVEKENKTKLMTNEQSNHMQAFIEKLPLTNNNYEIGYSSLLGEFFIFKKSQDADLELAALFQTNNMEDIQNEFPELFVNVDKPVDEAITQAEDAVINNRKPQ